MNTQKFRFYALWLSLVCIVVFVLQLAISGFTKIFMLTPDALSMPWQFLTAVFLHGSVVHLLYNLFALVLFGLMLEKFIGGRRFLILFFISGIFANIISFIAYPSQNSLGASGAIMAVIGVVAVLKPMMTIWLYSMPMPMFIAAILWVGGSVLGIFGFGDQNIGYLAHLSGIFIGIFYGFYLRIRAQKRMQNNQIVFERKIVIPEESMRGWEKDYFGK